MPVRVAVVTDMPANYKEHRQLTATAMLAV